MKKLLLSFCILLAVCVSLFAQTMRAVPGQVYRLIHFSGDERAGDVRWIEIWETQTADGDFEWVMTDSEWIDNIGIESSCYSAVAIGNGAPLYMEDGEIQPVETRDQLIQELENRRLVLNSEFYVEDNECTDQDTAIINGVPAESCRFEDTDASGIFLIKPPATSFGELWRAEDTGIPVRYTFEADGSSGDVAHRYELIPDADVAIQPPAVPELLCVDGDFPVPPNTSPVSKGSITFAALQSDLGTTELQTFYDNALTDNWTITSNLSEGGRVYSRELESGTICTLEMRFRESPTGLTGIAASVYPEDVNLESLEVTTDFESPVVVQSYASIQYTETGTTEEIVNRQIERQGDDWFVRADLTDIREESAFVVLAQNDSQQEVYITVDRLNATESTVQVQTRPGICGPTFEVGS